MEHESSEATGIEVEGFGVDPFAATPAELLASVADLAPGPMLLSVLLMVDRSSLDPDAALQFLVLHDRVTAWWQGLQSEALVAAAGPEARMQEFLLLDPRPDHDEERMVRIEDAVREEVAAALRWSPATAQSRIDAARLLAGPLAATAQALAHGEISAAHAAAVVEAVERLSSRLAGDPGAESRFVAQCRAVQRRVLPVARRSTVARTRRAAARWVERLDAAGQAERRRQARATRSVHLGVECDGVTPLIARLDSTTARCLMATIDAAVTDPAIAGDCAASIGERRAEALAALVLGAAGGREVHVELQLTIPVRSLTSPEEASRLPEGLGSLLEDPAVQCSVRPIVTADDGHVLDVGRRRYVLPTALRRLIVARDRTCRFPGCGRPAARCQVDHAVAWDDGGATDVANLGALCTRHHQLKTLAGWQVTASQADGSCTWVSPLGRTYTRPPEPVGDVPAERPVVDPDPPPF